MVKTPGKFSHKYSWFACSMFISPSPDGPIISNSYVYGSIAQSHLLQNLQTCSNHLNPHFEGEHPHV